MRVVAAGTGSRQPAPTGEEEARESREENEQDVILQPPPNARVDRASDPVQDFRLLESTLYVHSKKTTLYSGK